MRTLLIAAVLGLTGCAELSLFTWKRGHEILVADSAHPVAEILCLWEPSQGTNQEGQPSRGFAGQIYFFTRGHSESAKVNGKVTIYLFDDHGTPEEQSKPIQQLDLTSEEWNYFLTLPKVGPAYQLFLPYSRPGNLESHCTIRVKFTPADGGPPVFSRMATVALPGRKRPTPSPQARALARDPAAATAAFSSAPTVNVSRPWLEQQLAGLRDTAQQAATSTGPGMVTGAMHRTFEPQLLNTPAESAPISPHDFTSADSVGKYRLAP